LILEKDGCDDDTVQGTMGNSVGSTGSISSSGSERKSSNLKGLTQSSNPVDAELEIPTRIRIDDEKDSSRNFELPNELISPDSLALEKVMDYLDTKSLKACRQVDGNWEEAARRVLMKRQKLNIVEFLTKTKKTEQERVQLYRSWTVEYNPPRRQKRVSKKFLQEWGEAVKCLTLTGLSLDLKCMAWIRNILSTWCPNLTELCLEFGMLKREKRSLPRRRKSVDDKQVEDFSHYLNMDNSDELRNVLLWKKQHTFAPYPILPNLHTLRVGKKSNKISSYLAIIIILSSPNLRHLFLSELRCDRPWEWKSFRIIDYLSRRPDITLKLESFAWQDANERFGPFEKYNSTYILYLFDNWEEEMKKFAAQSRIRNNLPLIQFGDKLKSLHWDVLHVYRRKLLLPGILEQVAGNIRKLDLRKAPRLRHLPEPTLEPMTREQYEAYLTTQSRHIVISVICKLPDSQRCLLFR
jgi:hypothetical protein